MTTNATIDIPGLTITYKAWGAPDKPVLLALHGWLDNANSFDDIASSLTHKFYVVAIDLPGHGASSFIAKGHYYQIIDSLFMLVTLIRALKIEKAHLLGHSLGACLSSLLAGIAPQYVASVALIEGLGPFSSPEHTSCQQLSRFIDMLPNIRPFSSKTYTTFTEAVNARMQNGELSYKLAHTLALRGVSQIEGGFQWHHDRRLLVETPLRMTEPQILSCLKAIKVPSCLIVADKGLLANNAQFDARLNAVNHLQVNEIQGHHHVHMQHPDVVSDILTRFYAAL